MSKSLIPKLEAIKQRYNEVADLIIQPDIFKYISDGDDIMLEKEPLENLAKDGKLNAYKHDGFWKPMDTMRDKHSLTEMWVNNKAPWAKWKLKEN